MFRSRSRTAFLGLLLLLLLVPFVTRADEGDERLDRFLTSLELNDLRMVHLENMITLSSPTTRGPIAKRLADLYAAGLINSADDRQKYDDILTRVRRLMDSVPEARTPSLEVMLLQADFNRAEAEIGKWISDPRKTGPRDRAREILEKIAHKLDGHQRELNAKVERLVEEIEKLDDEAAEAIKEKELNSLSAVSNRAAFFAGWSNYYYGLARFGNASARAEFAKAREVFRRFLGIAKDDRYSDLDAESLGLDSEARARGLIGLILAETALDETLGGKTLYKLLKSPIAPPTIQDEAAYWHIQGLINVRKFDDARRFGKFRIDEFASTATRGKVSLCVAMVRAGFGTPAAGAEGAELGRLGLSGLAKLRQQGVLRKLIDDFEIDLGESPGFFLQWIKGQQLLAAAEKSKTSEDYEKAAEALAEALKDPAAQRELAAAGQCRYEMAWCRYRAGDLNSAARNFQQAVTGLKTNNEKSAVNSAWMAFVCYHKLVKDQPQLMAAAVEVLDGIKRDFPGHRYAKQAEYYKSKLRQAAGSLEETIANLEKVPPDSPSYLSARYDLCILWSQQWSQARGKSGEAAAAAKTQQAVDDYLSKAQQESVSRRLKACLLAAELGLSGSSKDAPLATAYLKQAAPFVSSLPEKDPLAAEFHYRALQLAGQQADEAARRRHAKWLTDNAAGSAYELPALIVSAKAVDEAVNQAAASANVAEAAQRRQEAFNVYSRLVKVLGDSPAALGGQSKNARVASSKMAQYAFDAGRYRQAAAQLEKLLAAFPKETSYLRRAGLAQFRAGAYDKSVVHWRVLLRGLNKESDEWFEAKYHQIACLERSDKATAKKVFQQFELLYPRLGPATWRTKFTQLKERLR